MVTAYFHFAISMR